MYPFSLSMQRGWRALALALVLCFLLAGSLNRALAFDEEGIPFYDPLDAAHPEYPYADPAQPNQTSQQVSSVHFDLVGALALAAGLSQEDAARLQLYSQLTDSSIITAGNHTYRITDQAVTYPQAPDPTTLAATDYCPSPETTAYSVTMGGTTLMECPECFTSRFGPFGVFFHEPHNTPDELQAIHKWAFGETSDLTAKVTFGYSSTVPFTWEPLYTVANVANVYEATSCFYTQTDVKVDTGNVAAGSIEALGIYLHALGDHWSHRECIQAADDYSNPDLFNGNPLPFAAHVTVKGPDDPLWACRWTSHEVEFGDMAHSDAARTYTGTVEIYKAMLSYVQAGKGQPTYNPIALEDENGYINSFLHDQFVQTNPEDAEARRALAEDLGDWALFTRIHNQTYRSGSLSAPDQAGDLAVQVYTPPQATNSPQVVYSVAESSAHPAPAGMQVVGSFTLTAQSPQGKPITQFQRPLSLLVNYPDTVQNINESTLGLYIWDETNSAWKLLFSAVDAKTNQVVGETDQLSTFALMAPESTVLAESDFSTGIDGWRVDGDVQNGSDRPSYLPAGGNPGGALAATDNVEGGTWYWIAPAKFLGNVTAVQGKSLSFDLRQISEMKDQYRYPDVVLKGERIALIYTYSPVHSPRMQWTHYSIPIDVGAGWRVVNSDETFTDHAPIDGGRAATQSDFDAVLSDLRSLMIRGEYEDGADVGYLDNVVLGADEAGNTAPVYPIYLPQVQR